MDSLSPNKPSGPGPGLSPIGSGPSMSSASPAKGSGGGLHQMDPAPKPVSTPMSPATKRKIGFGIVAALTVAGIAAAVLMGGGGGPQPAPAPMPAPQVVQAAQPQVMPAQITPQQIVGQVGAIRETSPPGGPMYGFYATLTTVTETSSVIGNNGSDLITTSTPVVGWQFVGFTGPECAAVLAGCQIGDVMVSYRGERTAEDGNVVSRIHASGTEHPLDPIEVVVIRNGQRIVLNGPVGFVSSFADLHP